MKSKALCQRNEAVVRSDSKLSFRAVRKSEAVTLRGPKMPVTNAFLG